jgi:hypothetical protein
MRKVYVELKVRVILNIEEGIELQRVISELGHEFSEGTGLADIEYTEITGFEIQDSK